MDFCISVINIINRESNILYKHLKYKENKGKLGPYCINVYIVYIRTRLLIVVSVLRKWNPFKP